MGWGTPGPYLFSSRISRMVLDSPTILGREAARKILRGTSRNDPPAPPTTPVFQLSVLHQHPGCLHPGPLHPRHLHPAPEESSSRGAAHGLGEPLPAKGEVHMFWILASTLPGHHLLPAWFLLPPSSPSPHYVSNRRLWDSRTI